MLNSRRIVTERVPRAAFRVGRSIGAPFIAGFADSYQTPRSPSARPARPGDRLAVSLSSLTLTGGGGGGGAHADYALAGMIIFEGIAVCVSVLLVVSHLIESIPVERGVLLGIAAGLGFGISDVAIKALSGDVDSGPVGLLSPWSVIIVTAAVFSFFAFARSLQIGDGVAVIAVTSVAANLSTIVAGLAVVGDRLGNDALVIGVRLAAFALILVGAALIPAPVRAGEALEERSLDATLPVSPGKTGVR